MLCARRHHFPLSSSSLSSSSLSSCFLIVGTAAANRAMDQQQRLPGQQAAMVYICGSEFVVWLVCSFGNLGRKKACVDARWLRFAAASCASSFDLFQSVFCIVFGRLWKAFTDSTAGHTGMLSLWSPHPLQAPHSKKYVVCVCLCVCVCLSVCLCLCGWTLVHSLEFFEPMQLFRSTADEAEACWSPF